jgi:hypothetical protein
VAIILEPPAESIIAQTTLMQAAITLIAVVCITFVWAILALVTFAKAKIGPATLV